MAGEGKRGSPPLHIGLVGALGRHSFFYYLVFGKFLTRPRVGGGNKNKMTITSVSVKFKLLIL